MLELIRSFFKMVALTSLPGGIPLDIVLHLILGTLIFIGFLKIFPERLILALFLVFFIAVSKELFDLGVVMRNQFYLEPFKDIAVTMVAPFIFWTVSRNKTYN